MSVTLAGWRVRLDVKSEELVAAFAPRYAPFCDFFLDGPHCCGMIAPASKPPTVA